MVLQLSNAVALQCLDYVGIVALSDQDSGSPALEEQVWSSLTARCCIPTEHSNTVRPLQRIRDNKVIGHVGQNRSAEEKESETE